MTQSRRGSPPKARSRAKAGVTVAPAAALKAAIDCQSDAVGVMDLSLRFLAINSAWMETMGFGQEAIGRTALELFNDPLGLIEKDLRTALGGREVIKTFNTPNDSRLRHVSIKPWRDETGEIGGVIARHAIGDSPRQQLEGRERRLSVAMEMAKVFAYEIDFRTGRVTHEPAHPEGINDACFFSYEDILTWLPETERQVQRDAWEKHLATGELMIQEYRRMTPEGGWRWERSVSEAVRDQDNQVVGLSGASQIIDDRKQAELELVAEKEAAQAADRAKSEFLANMSHEIRTPLTSVIGFADLLRKLDGLPDQAHVYIQRVTAAGQSLLSVINDVLDVSKLEAGQVELDPHPFDPGECIEAVAGLLTPQAAAKGLDLGVHFAPDVPTWVTADSARIRQVLINLLGNAVKFTEAGRVTVSATYSDRAPGSGDLRIAVTDTGPGVAEDARDRLFQRFSQVDGSVSRKHGGSGLGLAICKGLIELMGGAYGVDSEVGKGSTFWFSVPVSTIADTIESPAQPDFEHLESRPAHILLVDDVAVNRELVRAMLTPFGHSFEEADNGADAVKAAMRSRFDLILMDLQMPGMDGFAAARAIRATAEPNRATPILALSANVLSEHTAAARAAGMDDHIGKPIQPIELLTKVAIWTEASPDDDAEVRTAC